MRVRACVYVWVCALAGLFAVSAAPVQIRNFRPIIGIVTVPDTDADSDSTIPGSYVKFLESAGARVAVIPFNSSPSNLTRLFHGVNGLLFTGGDLSLLPNTTYYKSARHLFDLAKQEWEAGVHFPVHGTCMGHQLLTLLVAEDQSVLLRYQFDSENLPLPLNLTHHAPHSRLFGTASPSVLHTLTSTPSTINLHHDGILPESFHTNARLAAHTRVLSTNVDRKGKPFVSAFEGKEYPFYGVQFHPERNAFEFDPIEETVHTWGSIAAMTHIANVIVEDARRNSHQFPTLEEETKSLIYNYNSVYTANDPSETYPDEITYFFK